MKKQKKITIKPYINYKVEPEVVQDVGGTDNYQTQYLYPLYYQIIYNKQNTHIKSFYGSNYKELIDEVQFYGNPMKVVGFESKIIERIIRYNEKKNDQFGLKGIAFLIATDGEYLTTKLNLKAKKLIISKLQKKHYRYATLFDYKSSRVSFYFLLQVLTKLDLDSVIDQEIRNKMEHIKYFCQTYITEYYSKLGYVHEVQTGLYVEGGDSLNSPTIIDWTSGSIHKEFGTKFKQLFPEAETDPQHIIESVEWLMNLNIV